jgi:hypothetical protein
LGQSSVLALAQYFGRGVEEEEEEEEEEEDENDEEKA